MMLHRRLEEKIQQCETEGLFRERFSIEQREGARVSVNGKRLVHFSSNDYLGITTHPKVKEAFIQGVHHYGFGSGASAMVSGLHAPHTLLEEKMAEFLQRERAILFNSGYLANLGVMATLSSRQQAIVSDKLCHASLLDGIQLSRAKHSRFRHKDEAHAEKLLSRLQPSCLLVTESVFSMEGSIAPVDRLAALAQRFQATLVVDDAHGIGVLGERGAGICEHLHLSQEDVPCLIVPLGKSFGSMGAIVAGSHTLVESLIQLARTYRYTTAAPPAIAFATLEALNVIQTEAWRRKKLQALIHYFIHEAKKRSLSLAADDATPIKSLVVGDNKKAVKIQKALMQAGFFVSCIRPPTVPMETARIRISLSCLHEEKDISLLLDLLADCNEKFH